MRSLLMPCLSAAVFAAGLALPARAEIVISVDKDDQRMTVAVDGQTRYTWPVSTGIDGYDTPGGRHGPFRMERTHRSREFDDAPMPNAIFFTGQGHAIHGTNHTRQLGRAASHGCVRLAPRNAATLFDLVRAQGMANTRVVVEGGALGPSRRRGGEDGLVSAGMQMGREPYGRLDAPVAVPPAARRRRPAYDRRDPEGYGDGFAAGDAVD